MKNKKPKKHFFEMNLFRMEKIKNKLSGGLIFILIVCAVYLIVFFFNNDLVFTAMIDTAKLFIKLIPVLVLVFAIQTLNNKYVKGKIVKKYLGHESNWKGWFYASIFGILVSGPPYILFPMLSDLKKKGMSDSSLAVFLYNRNVKLPFLPVMVYYFGLAFTTIISIYIILFSILNGFLVGKIINR